MPSGSNIRLPLHDLIEALPDATLVVDERGIIVEASFSCEQLFGYGPRALHGRRIESLIPKHLRDRHEGYRAEYSREPRVRAMGAGVLLYGLRQDGSEFPAEISLSPLATREGRFVIAAIRDGSQRRAIEENVRALVEAAPDAMVVAAEDGRIVLVNARAEALFGYAREEMLGRPVEMLVPERYRHVHPAHRAGFFAHPRTRAMGAAPGLALYGRRKDGSELPVDISLSPFKTGEGTFAITSVRDATERLKFESERAARHAAEAAKYHAERQREDIYRIFMQAPFEMTILRGSQLVIEFANEQSLKALGAGPNILGRRYLDVLPQHADQPLYERLLSVYSTGVAYEGRGEAARVAGEKGELRDAYWNYAYVPLIEAGEVVGVAAYAFEVTDQVRAEQRHREANERLLAVDRSKDEFLVTMSHELRTPLNSMLGWATMLRKVPNDDEKRLRGLEVIERNARAQERLINDLLDMSRIVSGKLKLTMTKVPLGEVVDAAADVVRPAAESKGVRLTVDLSPDLGNLIGDPARLQQVMWNLLINAVKFTPHGGTITIHGGRLGSSMWIRVQDTGAGIAPEHLPHLFERFRQVDSSTTRKHGGLGLGLAIVRHLVEAHGGSVEAQSEGIGRGAAFTILLPIRALDLPEISPETAQRVAEAPAEGEVLETLAPSSELLKGVRVLVVEDDRDSLELLRVVLEGAGAKVTATPSARDALDTGEAFDVIVSDIGMPEMDGYTFIRSIRTREVGSKVPAVALTAYARPEDARRAMRAGFQEHLSKPIAPSALIDIVRKWSEAGRGAATGRSNWRARKACD
jgi:PAS domain S-box-containing protein